MKSSKHYIRSLRAMPSPKVLQYRLKNKLGSNIRSFSVFPSLHIKDEHNNKQTIAKTVHTAEDNQHEFKSKKDYERYFKERLENINDISDEQERNNQLVLLKLHQSDVYLTKGWITGEEWFNGAPNSITKSNNLSRSESVARLETKDENKVKTDLMPSAPSASASSKIQDALTSIQDILASMKASLSSVKAPSSSPESSSNPVSSSNTEASNTQAQSTFKQDSSDVHQTDYSSFDPCDD